MSAIPVPEVRISADKLHVYVRRIFESAGSLAREAELVADHLIAANLAGHDSHGVGMIPRYVAALGLQELQLNAHARVVRDFGAVLTVEGGRGLGQVIAHEAMAHGIERARKLGIAAVGLRDSHHIGRIGHWAEQCARAGLASFHFVNVAGDAFVAPLGGMDRRFGTNPFCAAFPRAGQPPLVLDFATSGIAFGKTRVAYNKGETVGPGNLIDHTGRPSIEPKVMHEPPFGALLPFGGHKGSGLAVMCEILAGAMAGGVTTHERTLVTGSGIINGMMSVIVDPQAFDAPDAQAETEAFVEWIRATRLAPDGDPIQLPGEPERRRQTERALHGIPVDATTWEQIRCAALTAGMPPEEVGRRTVDYAD
ncbi:malate/lactate/ureidoglycolate dehydrogenase [Robbsia sp. Bb-Pol-6]|uniref:Malate/lactate/ureidoglycolate dehydrogenase n=1 Tax=Robbsia betulipollinis TaxID=2981849 RepID=A0ABT3ZU12_9BURK|nr:malate/lactate/ureidoglycolate dehydrogenase [Robbsia betulipollinis]MCY0389700.1 malate/lactate/ureidoglycolate dehydrogenase [Robbsia betulipollinis]